MRNPDEGPGDGIQQRKSDLILAGVILVWGASRVLNKGYKVWKS